MQPTKLLMRLVVVKSTVWLAIMGVLLFLPAGHYRWPQAWAFLAIFTFGSVAFSAWLWRRDPALLAARLGPLIQRGQPLWDQIFLVTFIALWCGWLVLMALDTQVWHTSDMPPLANALGGLLVIAGYAATLLVFRENSFATPVIRVQTEREHHVIDTGPYALVRHPMYAAALLYLVGMPLLLGSWYGLLVVPVIMAGVSWRAVFEERLLKRDLPGYADYMARVRYRLIPGVW
jgi:protein-S-isoprenylcysteine O-methyltransferase Ste14